jgi:acyl-CoA synthetase (AMP-forming)/AMP-acid ligase II
VADRLVEVANAGRGSLVFHLLEGKHVLRSDDLAERAQAAASSLLAAGVTPGDRIGLLGRNRPEWAVWAFATWLAGCVLVPIQVPLRVRDREAFKARTASLTRAAGCRRVITAPELLGAIDSDLAVDWTEPRRAQATSLPDSGAESPAVIQFTSGSTAEPRGVVVSHAAVLAQMDALNAACTDGSGTDVALGWVPFFHDLGLFFFLVHPVLHLEAGHILPTERFAKDPAEWLRLVGQVQATIIDAPQSAWAAATSAARRDGESLDLRTLRVAWFAAESVEPAFVDGLHEIAPHWGLARAAVGSTYGLAEAVLGVSATPRGEGIRILDLDRNVLASEGRAVPAAAAPTRVVSSGRPLNGAQIRVVGAEGAELPDGHVGEIEVSGASLMNGYLGGASPVDGWIQTGDLGFLHERELYVTGRSKDVLIIMGQNYYPEDFEWAAGRVQGVRPGRVVAFTADCGSRVVVVAEPRGVDAPTGLARAVALAVADAIDSSPPDVLLVPPGTIEKTTSGKLRRQVIRRQYEAGTLGGT